MKHINESDVEEATLSWFEELGYEVAYGPDLAPGEPHSERESFGQVCPWGRLRQAMGHINPKLPDSLLDEAIKRLQRAESQNPVAENQRWHRLMTDGVPVEQRGPGGQLRTVQVWLIDWEKPSNNDWLVVNQFTVVENGKNRRPDVLVFVNGMPLGLFELKNSADENATLRKAWNQIQTYQAEIPSVFTPNAVTVISDGTSAAMGSFTGAFEHYAPWKTIDSQDVVTNKPALEILVKGVFEPHRFLDLVRNFIVFSEETATDKRTAQRVKTLVKRVAKYHQYWAVNVAVESTVRASRPNGNRRAGVVWHTQGSGKSFERFSMRPRSCATAA